jgi:hypothetical protein
MRRVFAATAVLLWGAYACSSHTPPPAQPTTLTIPPPPPGIRQYCPKPYLEDAGSMWICDSGFTPDRAHACDNNGRNGVKKTDYAVVGTDSESCPANAWVPNVPIAIIQGTHATK